MVFEISIHAPRVGRDNHIVCDADIIYISIHAPRVGRDPQQRKDFFAKSLFQSTRPVWGATTAPKQFVGYNAFQSTRPVWGATRVDHLQGRTIEISIHAPRVGRDKRQPRKARLPREFQSTRPVWGATPLSSQ